MQIQAAVCREKGSFAVESVELSDPQLDEVIVRIVACGMCHTDLAVRDQHIPLPLPAVLGHEGASIVERVGPGVSKVGDRAAHAGRELPGFGRFGTDGLCRRQRSCLADRAGRPPHAAQGRARRAALI